MLTCIVIPEAVTVVVLDLDGTIYRKPRMAWYMICRQLCHLPSLIAERRWRKAQRRALKNGNPMPPMPVDEQWYKQCYLPAMVDIIAKHYKPAPWLRQLIDDCQRRKVRLIVLSDYEAAADKLQVLGLDSSAFDAILSAPDFGTIKPDPHLGDVLAPYITSNAAVDWQHVMFIGDREDTDGLLAQALGAQFRLV